MMLSVVADVSSDCALNLVQLETMKKIVDFGPSEEEAGGFLTPAEDLTLDSLHPGAASAAAAEDAPQVKDPPGFFI